MELASRQQRAGREEERMKQHRVESTTENSSMRNEGQQSCVWRLPIVQHVWAVSGAMTLLCKLEKGNLWQDADLWVHSLSNRVYAKLQALVGCSAGHPQAKNNHEALDLQYHVLSRSLFGIQKCKDWDLPRLL